MLGQTTAGSLFTESEEKAAIELASPRAEPTNEREGISVYRLRSSGTTELSGDQQYMWRRLFRIVDRPKLPPFILDCDSLGLETTENIAMRFWNDKDLWSQQNLILIASATSAWEEFAARCRAQREDLIVGDNWGILILEEPSLELPALLRTAADLGGWIVTTGRSLCDETKPIHCSGDWGESATSLFGKRDGKMERRLGIAPPH